MDGYPGLLAAVRPRENSPYTSITESSNAGKSARSRKRLRDIYGLTGSLMETAPNVQRDAAASTQVPQEAANANALEKQKLQASQQPVSPSIEFWEQLLSTLGQIKSNTDQMVKLMTDGHGFGPHRSAAGSSKRKRVEKEQERSDNKEAENQDQNKPLPQ